MENSIVQIPNGTVLVPLDQYTYITEQAARMAMIEELTPDELADKYQPAQIYLEGIEALKAHIKWEKERQTIKADPDDAVLPIIPPVPKTIPACPDIEEVKALCAAGLNPGDIAFKFGTDAATVETWLNQERRNPTDGNSK